MNTQKYRRFASIGLYVAALAGLISIGLYIVQRALTLPLQISLGLIVVGLAVYVLLNPQGARQALTGRQARHGSNALVMLVAFVGILVVVNFLANSYSKQWDITEDRSNSLTPETVQALASLSTPVTAEAYYTSAVPVDSAQTLLENYKNHSEGKFNYEFIDPQTNPVRAQQAQITRDATIVLRMEDRQEQVTFASEQELTGALIRLANPGERAVYFLTGHGEFNLDSTDDVNYSAIQSMLASKNYTVNTLNLLSTPEIPADALAVIVAGPLQPVSEAEVALLRAYLDGGGALIYLSEPRPTTDFGDAADPLAEYLQASWGITLGEDVIINLDPASGQYSAVVVSDQFAEHPITQKMYSLAAILPGTRSVQAAETAPDGITLNEIAFTTSQAWGETDTAALQNNQAQFDQNDLAGPLSFAVAGESSASGARVLVIGDAQFASSQAYDQYGNSDLLLNGIDWAAEQDNLISLTPREPIERFVVAPQPYTMGLILLGSVFLLPGLVLLLGITTWIQRRRRG